MSQNNPMLESALRYAAAGLAVFPVRFKRKEPATPNGFKSATTDPEQIKKWWGQPPGDKNNIGITAGAVSGNLVVIDIDKSDKKDGYQFFSEWLDKYGALPETAAAVTGSGGMHLLFRSEQPEKSRIGIYPGIDIRAEGSYIVAPPSLHPNGQTYQWEKDIAHGIAQADTNVLAFLHPLEDLEHNTFDMPELIPEGERNRTLFAAACSMRDKDFGKESILASIRAENQKKCAPPLEDKEVQAIVRSALKYEPEHSYTATAAKGKIKSVKKPIKDLSTQSLKDVKVEDVDWLIVGYIPRGQVSTLVGDGGSGKTTGWCSIVADISAGRKTFLESEIPGKWYSGDPQSVLFFSSEDSVKHVLKPRLLKHGANMDNIHFIDLRDERFEEIKFNSRFLRDLVAYHRPALVVFDPLQSFIPADIKMGQRNAMRSCLNPLIGLGEEYGTTFLIIVHTNKQDGLWGRKRMADSSDVWDISRSVLMMGETQEEGIRYLSQEKSNYGPLEQTVLFSLNGGVLEFKGYSTKKDKDFVKAWSHDNKENSPANGKAKEAAKEFILEYLADGEKEVAEVDEMGKAQGHSNNALRNAKSELKAGGMIKYRYEGKGKNKGKQCFIYTV